MAWTNIPNANLAAGAPIRSVDILALRDNVVALGNQEAGAPTLVKSLNGQTGAITNTDFNAIGSYAVGTVVQGGNAVITTGQTFAGSSIVQRDSNTFAAIQNNSTNTNLGKTGTWRSMSRGVANPPNCCGLYAIPVNLWVRIS